jgi:hypothetical protein
VHHEEEPTGAKRTKRTAKEKRGLVREALKYIFIFKQG